MFVGEESMVISVVQWIQIDDFFLQFSIFDFCYQFQQKNKKKDSNETDLPSRIPPRILGCSFKNVSLKLFWKCILRELIKVFSEDTALVLPDVPPVMLLGIPTRINLQFAPEIQSRILPEINLRFPGGISPGIAQGVLSWNCLRYYPSWHYVPTDTELASELDTRSLCKDIFMYF